MTTPIPLRFLRLNPAARLPALATDGAACFDLYACSIQDRRGKWMDSEFVGRQLDGGDRVICGTGLAVEVPPGHALMIYSRSGQGFKHDTRLANCVGVIDSDYRGEIMVKLTCDGPMPMMVGRGDRIAQAMLIPVPAVDIVEVDRLSETARGAGGLGSTGA